MFFSNNLDLESKGAGRTRRSEWITMRKGTKQSRLYELSRKRVGAGDPQRCGREWNSELETKEEAG